MKRVEDGNFAEAWGGIAGLQFSLPVIWTESQKRGYSISQIANWLSTAPAKFLGLEHQKGKISAGFDADLVIWDPEGSTRVTEGIIQHKHKTTPYLGLTLAGKVKQTFVAGKKVFAGGQFKNPNSGSLLLRQP